jgi:copper homeostasis protein
MSIFLEVIVTSIAEAIAAEQGGADRLELVRSLDQGGLSPSPALVKDVLSAVNIPVRVMVREVDSMRISGSRELDRLKHSIEEFSHFAIDGLVLGYLHDDAIDDQTLAELTSEEANVTFHRAFDEAADPASAIACLKKYPRIDRILTRAGAGPWPDRKARLEHWQSMAQPEIRMLFAVGPDTSRLHELQESGKPYEVHVGRAARLSHLNSGPVSAEYVAALKAAWNPQTSLRDHSL